MVEARTFLSHIGNLLGSSLSRMPHAGLPAAVQKQSNHPEGRDIADVFDSSLEPLNRFNL